MSSNTLKGIRKLSAALMLLSGVTHLSQLVVYGFALNVIGAATFGAIYLVVGIYLLKPGTLGLWLGSYLPLAGGIMGACRYLLVHNNPFSLFHIGIDLIVVPSCLYLLALEYRRLQQVAVKSYT
ncbi:hypothetical protein RDI61_15485 [Pseudomonas plecoglossicida]|jgi:hypothetical protein|uniref:hypothetical protein n=1 Tax=Pseudomonas TaxID=286 RepID=UPI000A6D786C|nr:MULTISPECIES: hypothetical protein [Pseudomonas]EKT4502980.1 hypothetical protein [Pseudomonas putida]EKT4540634.1 hypothetical protein [Pseudomonas putida]ELS0921818.1 hypothetical protein [Pseudomonas putida]MCE0901210.1 hypothetical protein [Pseudomonas alloputida]MCE0988820.1 hypothetical protein [Pseudomonas alloputida]